VENRELNIPLGKNYAVVMGLLKYSQKKLFANIVEYNKYVLTQDNIFEKSNQLQKLFNVTAKEVDDIFQEVVKGFAEVNQLYNVVTIKDSIYPELLKMVSMPPPVLYLRGDVNLFTPNTIAVVGSRTPTDIGKKRAVKLAYLLAENGFTVVSGLAKGIDANAHNGAIKASGKTIAVIGTPLNKSYPKENAFLQEKIAESYLLVSQFPFSQPTTPLNFPTRNYTMCGLTRATIIVEASERSGTLTQAKFCIREGRRLFILKSILDRKDLTWPRYYVNKGAKILEKIEDVEQHLDDIQQNNNPDTNPINKQMNLF
jgi:DNA processing protein